jgi:hypothetical protein
LNWFRYEDWKVETDMNLLLIIGLTCLIAAPFVAINTAIPIYLLIQKRKQKKLGSNKKSKK